jgi:hypothetical protein
MATADFGDKQLSKPAWTGPHWTSEPSRGRSLDESGARLALRPGGIGGERRRPPFCAAGFQIFVERDDRDVDDVRQMTLEEVQEELRRRGLPTSIFGIDKPTPLNDDL